MMHKCLTTLFLLPNFKKISFWAFIFFLFVSLQCVNIANTQTFQWPVSPGEANNPKKLTQDYAEFNGFSRRPNHYHTGLDIAAGKGTGVYSASDGYVEAVCPDVPGGCIFNGIIFAKEYTIDNHGVQGVIILRHHLLDEVVYSLYAHLGGDDPEKSIANGVFTGFTPNQFVPVGTLLGITNELNHVHFEIKDEPVLHNPSERNNSCIDPKSGKLVSLCWGYTSDPPNQHGYRDAVLYLHPISQNFSNPIPIDVQHGPLNVRAGPSTDYPLITNEPVSQITTGQQFVAFNKSGDWYQIHLSVPLSSTGVVDGWVNRDFVIENSLAGQIEVRNTGEIGLDVWPNPGTGTRASIAKVWDRQRFVPVGNQTKEQGCSDPYQWNQIHLPANVLSPTGEGWICAEFKLTLTPCSRYASGDPAPSPYGLAWNWFSSEKELLLSAACESDRTTITVGSDTAPSTGPGRTLSWGKVYAYDGQSWNINKPIPVTCDGEEIPVTDATPADVLPDYWCQGTLTGSLSTSISWFIGVTCIYTGLTWQCGCTDEQCSSGFWQLQEIER